MKLKAAYMKGLLIMIMATPGLAGQYQAPQDISFTATLDGSTQRYVQMLPQGFDGSQAHDVIIALHGHGSDRWQYVTDPRDETRATRDIAASHNMIYISPDYRATTSWMGPAAEADMLQIIQRVKQQYNVDKVIVTGGSMGGTSALTFAALHPGLVDGVSSANGLADHMTYTNFQDAIAASFGGTKAEVPDEYIKRSAINSPQSFTMPLAITAGGQDTSVPPQSVRDFYQTVSATNSKTIEFYRPATGHSTNYVDTAVALEYVIRQAHGVDARNPITINTSFESQQLLPGNYVLGTVDGWTVAGSTVGVVNSESTIYSEEYVGPKPDGDNTVFAKQAALFQYLGGTVQEGTYTMTITAGSQKSNAAIATFLAGFATADSNVAVGSDLAWASAESYTGGPGLTAGEWTTIILEWEVLAGDSAIGKELYLNLYANSDQWVHFDNVNITYAPVPEPAVMTLLALGATSALLRRKK